MESTDDNIDAGDVGDGDDGMGVRGDGGASTPPDGPEGDIHTAYGHSHTAHTSPTIHTAFGLRDEDTSMSDVAFAYSHADYGGNCGHTPVRYQ